MRPILLSTDARAAVLRAATYEAKRRRVPTVGSDHLLLALLWDPDGTGCRTLDVSLDDARGALAGLDDEALRVVGVETHPLPPVEPLDGVRRRAHLGRSTKDVLHRAVREAQERRARCITEEHLLRGLLGGEPSDPAILVLRRLGRDVEAIRRDLDGTADS